MISYQRCVGEIVLNILVDEAIYSKEKNVFDSLLQTFDVSKAQTFANNNIYYYIYGKSDSRKVSGNDYTVCDTEDEGWVFQLIKDLEGLYAAVLKCTVIHGSCINIHNKNILLMGERWSGKTTLTHYFAHNKNGEYLDDDCVYIINDLYVGFCNPIPMRNMLKSCYADNIICETVDSDGVIRTLYRAPRITKSFTKIDVVLFPKYGCKSKNHIKELDHANAFKKIIQNVRSYGKMKSMFADINKLSLNSKCYELEYSSSEDAYQILCRGII